MKNLFLIIAIFLSYNASAQITINNPNPGSIEITERNILFNPNYLSFYIRIDDYKIEPFKVNQLEQEYTTVLLDYSNLRPHEKSIPLYTIKISGTHISNGIREVYFDFKFTNLEAFLATTSLLENYDRKGKLILSRSQVNPQDAVNVVIENIANPSPGRQNEQPIFPIQNDIIEYIHN
ncbi:hypothetical protein KO494_08320 [Lacinutrix sp. C3R15]|uniref:hypothetical protein n=1 Tax=Flavobacteriaceae TaxID=49546 RepID=UPI001C084D04|nr:MULTISPECIES: hypothetical protein [Flavobacteriaceae]MBU2939544.1 hypothetical protein [Lacinutrix sp. C3R15]MDO6622858.1 hypothetical protein [Oceanihabitans sp. 1_MG-2023]